MGIRIGGEPVGVVFCTDEDFGGIPDESSADVYIRRSHIKFNRTLDNFETLGDLKNFWIDGRQAYAPGMIETKLNEVLVSIDHYAYYSVNVPIDGYVTDHETFFGLYNGFDEPQAVIAGQPGMSEAHGWSPIASHYIEVELKSGDIL